MRSVLCFVVTNLLYVQAFDEKPIYSENLGRYQFQAKSGVIPDRYYPLDENDEMDSRSMTTYLIALVKTQPPWVALNFNLTNFNPNSDTRDRFDFDLHAVYNIVMSGMNRLETYNVELRKNNRLDWSVYVPEVVTQADMYLRTHMGQLTARVRLTATGVAGHIVFGGRVLGYSNDLDSQRFQIDSAEVVVDIGNLQMSVTSIGDMSANLPITTSGRMLAQLMNKPEPLASTLLREVLPFANVALNMVPVSDVFKTVSLDLFDYDVGSTVDYNVIQR